MKIRAATQEAAEVVRRLKTLADPEAAAGMARFGIRPGQVLGIKVPVLRKMAKEIGRNHELALALWGSGLHEARILAAFIGEPAQVTEDLMEAWVLDFDSWDVCDQVCGNLFDRTPLAYRKALEWSERDEEFVMRAGFAMMATLAIHDKAAEDASFQAFFPAIRRGAVDERNFVKKAVNWALRQIGKRNVALNREAIEIARSIQGLESRAARWVASDALQELRSKRVQQRLAK
jgi:3-methyladenine DNA glycosylase AlkD